MTKVNIKLFSIRKNKNQKLSRYNLSNKKIKKFRKMKKSKSKSKSFSTKMEIPYKLWQN